jgi:hypothetical protein
LFFVVVVVVFLLGGESREEGDGRSLALGGLSPTRASHLPGKRCTTGLHALPPGPLYGRVVSKNKNKPFCISQEFICDACS